jgi:hypothetical protein
MMLRWRRSLCTAANPRSGALGSRLDAIGSGGGAVVVRGAGRRLRALVGDGPRRPAEHDVNGVRLTHVGGPTVLIEVGGWRLLTDPTCDAPGRTYSFGWGAASRKLAGPKIPVGEIGPIDAVLLTHDHHGEARDEFASDSDVNASRTAAGPRAHRRAASSRL